VKKIFAFLALSSLIITSNAQVSEQWVARYSGPSNFNDVAYAMALDASGNIYVTGTMTPNTGSDLVLIKYSPSGSQVWVKTFNGGTHDAGFAIAADNSGNVYVAGSSQGGNGMDYVTIKYSSAGDLLWSNFYEGPIFEEDVATSIGVDASGNVYVTGYSTGDGTTYDFATIKYSPSGVEQWVQRYNHPSNGEDVAASLTLDGSGNIYVTGRSNFDYTTIKYNPSGAQQWIQAYNGTGNSSDESLAIKSDGSGNIYVTGRSTGVGTNYDFATVKYNSSGVQQWASRYAGPSNSHDNAASLAVDASGNVYVAGGSNGDFAAVKYNSSGVQQWAQTYNGPGNAGDNATSLVLDASANVYVTGTSWGGPETQYDFATIKYNSSGAQQWVIRYNGPINFYDTPYSIAVDASGNVYAAGSSGGNGLDITTVKYSQTVGINIISGEIPNSFALFQNYPNPFNPVTKIRFNVASVRRTDIKLVIYDAAGKELATLVNKYLNPGSYEAEWDASNYPSGVYFYRITAGDYSETKKMALVK
jgi:uncharacterized delta-60 repeat protein